jgi:(hydroxyamino)benzene mutase
MDQFKRRLLWHGMLLFLLGLITGLVESQFANPRMGLAAHLEGLMNGIFLIAIGAIWEEINLQLSLKRATYWTLLYGTYANWAVTTLAAVFGTGAMMPTTAPGLLAQPWQESLVTAGFVSVGIAMVVASVLILLGLKRNIKQGPVHNPEQAPR